MKKYITLLSFIAVFFIGMQESQAQNATAAKGDAPMVLAKTQTHELHQLVGLTGKQQSSAYKVFVDLQQNLQGVSDNNDVATVQKIKSAVSETTKVRLKSILTKEQFEIYLKSLENSKE